jgi:hypothetical protein
LEVGQKIEVVDMNLKSLKGTFVGVSDAAISIRTDKEETAVERANVMRVSARGGKRGRNALIGLAIGAAAGITTMAIAQAKATETGPAFTGEGAAWLAAGAFWGGGIGAGIGALFPSHRTIYRVERRKDQDAP